MQNKERLKATIPLALVLVFSVVLYFLMEDFLADIIVKPLLKVAWFVSFILERLPQVGLWIVFILILLILTLTPRRRTHPDGEIPWNSPRKAPGVVENWTRLLESAQNAPYSRWRLAQRLKLLTQDILNPIERNRSSIDLLSEIDLPDEVRAYLEAPLPAGASSPKMWLRRKNRVRTALDLDPEIVYQYLRDRTTGREPKSDD